MVLATATRYLSGRGAVQTVYWKQSGNRMVKYSRVLTFSDKQAAAETISSKNGFPYRNSPIQSSAQGFYERYGVRRVVQREGRNRLQEERKRERGERGRGRERKRERELLHKEYVREGN
ncbi:hypothetical protein C0J52_04359 [Blattella germanica]|nr:hypothetical protein C0J52_04359 [Blattella germanica]